MVYFFEIIFYITIIINVYFFFFRPTVPLSEKLGMVLKIVGTYTFVFGLLAQTGISSQADFIVQDMTSANLYRFLRGNLNMMSLAAGAIGLMFDPSHTSISALSFLEMYVLLPIVLPFVMIYFVFHFIVIMPLTYIAYVLVSIPVAAITSSPGDFGLTFTFPSGQSTAIMVKELVSQHTISIKNFIIAFSSLGLALALRLYEFYKTGRKPDRLSGVWPQWFVRHCRTFVSRAIAIGLITLQAIIYIFIFVSVVSGLMMPFVIPPAPEGEASVKGEIIGTEIVLILVVTALVCQARNVRRYRLTRKATDIDGYTVTDGGKEGE